MALLKKPGNNQIDKMGNCCHFCLVSRTGEFLAAKNNAHRSDHLSSAPLFMFLLPAENSCMHMHNEIKTNHDKSSISWRNLNKNNHFHFLKTTIFQERRSVKSEFNQIICPFINLPRVVWVERVVRVEMPSASDPKIKILYYFNFMNAMVGNYKIFYALVRGHSHIDFPTLYRTSK